MLHMPCDFADFNQVNPYIVQHILSNGNNGLFQKGKDKFKILHNYVYYPQIITLDVYTHVGS